MNTIIPGNSNNSNKKDKPIYNYTNKLLTDNYKNLCIDKEDILPFFSDLTYYHPASDINKEIIDSKKHKSVLIDRKSIRVLTYNIFIRPITKNNESDWKDERLDDFLKILHNYDIICLQEMFGSFSNRKSKLIRAATKNGLFYYVELTPPNFYSKYLVDGGLLILSRFPIIKYAIHHYDFGVVSDSLSQKGIIYVQIEIGEGILHLFNTHTQASYNNDLYDLFLACYKTRMHQINQLGKFIKTILSKEFVNNRDLSILCGDMNIDALKYHKCELSNMNMISNIKKEYTRMIDIFKNNGLIVNDVFLNNYNYNPITYAEVDLDNGYFEKTLTHREDIGICQCLDYIFEINLDKFFDENNEFDDFKSCYYFTNNDDLNKSIANGIVGNEFSLIDHNKSIDELSTNFKNNKKLVICNNNTDSFIDVDANLTAIKTNNLNYGISDNRFNSNVIINQELNLNIVPYSIKVQKHLVSDLGLNINSRAYTQLSDHYGLSLLIDINKRYNKNKKATCLTVDIIECNISNISKAYVNENNLNKNEIDNDKDYDNLL